MTNHPNRKTTRAIATTLEWVQNDLGCQADSSWGMFFLAPAREKNTQGETMFDLTLLAPAGARGYRGEIHQTIGTFASPTTAKLAAEAVAALAIHSFSDDALERTSGSTG